MMVTLASALYFAFTVGISSLLIMVLWQLFRLLGQYIRLIHLRSEELQGKLDDAALVRQIGSAK
jgi:hypothetical protein